MSEELLARLLEHVENRFYGKYRAFVVDNADPQSRGRLRLKVPSVLGADVVTGWALPCTFYGGAADQGTLFIPEKDAGVWVEFEAGHLEHPIWVGTFWTTPGGKSEVPKTNKKDDGTVDDAVQNPPTRKIIKTLKGHTLQIEDKDGEEMILLVEATNKHVVVLNKDGIKITDGTNKNVITLDKDGMKLSVLEDDSKHLVVLNKEGIKVTDGVNKHELVLDASGIAATDGKNQGNKITMAAAGVTVEDKNQNQVVMASGGLTVKGTTGITLDSPAIKLGSGAVDPIVLGTKFDAAMQQLVTLINTHMHTGNLGAPTSPPMVPLTFVSTPFLSLKHKAE